MTRALADTSLFIARESGRTLAQIELPDELAISVITIGVGISGFRFPVLRPYAGGWLAGVGMTIVTAVVIIVSRVA